MAFCQFVLCKILITTKFLWSLAVDGPENLKRYIGSEQLLRVQ